MSREWKPGEVVVVLATFGPKDNAPSEYVASRNADGWTLLADRAEYWLDGNDDYDCKPVRPLVVLDPEDREAVERLQDLFADERDRNGGQSRLVVGGWADAMQAALREYANPKPPRIDEPGTWGVVEASCVHSEVRREWVHFPGDNWHTVVDGPTRSIENPDDWDSLIDPVLVRDGVDA